MIKRIIKMVCLIVLFSTQVFAEHSTLPDINPDPNIVEVILIAKTAMISYNGSNPTQVWTYNGIIPGPTIKANLGDKLIVHFFNKLPEETTVHWHGVDLPANMDGSNISQLAVQPGGYFRYEFDLLRAATYWYHPHIRGHEQVEKGLHGVLLVQDKQEDKNLGLPKKSRILVLDDILLDEDFNLAAPYPSDPLMNAAYQVNGREGNYLLANGEILPQQRVKVGKPYRFKVVNVSNSRFMRISVPGHNMWRVGGDQGLLATSEEIPAINMIPAGGHMMGDNNGEMNMISNPDLSKGILLTPGDRADIIVVFNGDNGEIIPLEIHDYPRGRHMAMRNDDGSIGFMHAHHDGKMPPMTILNFKLKNKYDNTPDDYSPPTNLRPIESIDVTNATTIPVMMGHSMPNPTTGDVTFFVQMKNGMGLPFNMVTAAEAPSVSVGDKCIISVANMTGGDHNFHLHGFAFQHIETQWIDMDEPDNNYTVPAGQVEWMDVVHLPKRPGMVKGRSRTVTKLAVSIDDTGREGQVAAAGKTPTETESGGWIFHCHILEHADRGMMSFLQVTDNGFNRLKTSDEKIFNIKEGVNLIQNHPNPFSNSTTIEMVLTEDMSVKLDVYNMNGQLINTLINENLEAGNHKMQWNGTRQTGEQVSNGIYFYRVHAGSTVKVLKMTLLK